MKEIKNYSYTADGIRIGAIVLVVIVHIAGGIVDYAPYFQSSVWWFANCIDAFSRVSVPLFIMLSGSLLLHESKHKESLRSYFSKRLKRVVIPLGVWSAIYVVWSYVYWSHAETPWQLLSDFFAPNIYYHLYFLYIILGLYALAPFLRLLLSHVSRFFIHRVLLYGFTFVGILYGVNALFPSARTTFNGLTLFIPYIPYFLAGSFLWEKTITKKTFGLYLGIYVVLALFTSVSNYFYMVAIGWVPHVSSNLIYDRYFYEHFSPNVIGMSLLGFILLRNIPLLFPIVRQPFLKRSILLVAPTVFGIYLLHPMVRDIVGKYFFTSTIPASAGESLWRMALLVVEITCIIGVSLLVVYVGRLWKPLRIIFG